MKSRNTIYNRWIKRFFDVILSSIVLIVCSPIYVVLIFCLYWFEGRPVWFKQIRLGLKGRKFQMYKFRTMKTNAEQLIEEFTEDEKRQYEENLKIKNDKRVTAIGRILRRTSLDELPQFWNILKGDMSLIGPRPIVEIELDRYAENKEKFLGVKPGLIGYWQAYSNTDTTYEQRMNMELYYVEHESFWFDVKIFLRSIVTVVKKAVIND